MKILCIDPSSTKTGFAVFNENRKLIRLGQYLPTRQKDDATTRIDAIIADLREGLKKIQPDKILIETTSGKVNRSRHGGGGAGLSTYGRAVGYHELACKDWAKCKGATVELINENEWTRGVAKKHRTAYVAETQPEYVNFIQKINDAGGDTADAIGLGLWWFKNRSIK